MPNPPRGEPEKLEKFRTLEELYTRIKELELEGASKFVSSSKDKYFGVEADANILRNHVVRFEVTASRSAAIQIEYDGIPFIHVARRYFDCHWGKAKQSAHAVARDPLAVPNKRIASTKKVDCPVRLLVKHIIKFPEFKLDGEKTQFRMRKASRALYELVKSGKDLSGHYYNEFYMTIPAPEQHKGHKTSGARAGFRPQLDPGVVDVLKEAVQLGVTKVNDIRSIIKQYVEHDLFYGQKEKPHRSDKKYYPTQVDIAKYVERSILSLRDKKNAEKLVSKWRQNVMEDFIFFREDTIGPKIPYVRVAKNLPKTLVKVDVVALKRMSQQQSGSPLIFCYQSMWQKRLMSLFGNQMTYVDPVSLSLPCVYPLYFLSVLTNVGYMIVGVIILEKHSVELLHEALTIFRNWNPEWKPSYVMVGPCQEDANVVQAVFKGSRLFISDYHRERTWQSWQDDTSDGIQNKGALIAVMKEIASAPSREKVKKSLEVMRESDEAWKADERLGQWFTENWEKRIKQWTVAYRNKVLDLMMNAGHIVNSTHKPIRPHRNSPVSTMIATLLKSYLPDSYRRYCAMNVGPLSDPETAMKLPRFMANSPNAVKECTAPMITLAAALKCGKIVVSDTEPGLYSVGSHSGDAHEVRIGNSERMPACSCKYWSDTKLPCCHFFAVVNVVPSVDWENFSKLYLECLLFRSDRQCQTIEPYSAERFDVEINEEGEEEEADVEEADVFSEVEESDIDAESVDYGALSDSPCNSPGPVVENLDSPVPSNNATSWSDVVASASSTSSTTQQRVSRVENQKVAGFSQSVLSSARSQSAKKVKEARSAAKKKEAPYAGKVKDILAKLRKIAIPKVATSVPPVSVGNASSVQNRNVVLTSLITGLIVSSPATTSAQSTATFSNCSASASSQPVVSTVVSTLGPTAIQDKPHIPPVACTSGLQVQIGVSGIPINSVRSSESPPVATPTCTPVVSNQTTSSLESIGTRIPIRIEASALNHPIYCANAGTFSAIPGLHSAAATPVPFPSTSTCVETVTTTPSGAQNCTLSILAETALDKSRTATSTASSMVVTGSGVATSSSGLPPGLPPPRAPTSWLPLNDFMSTMGAIEGPFIFTPLDSTGKAFTVENMNQLKTALSRAVLTSVTGSGATSGTGSRATSGTGSGATSGTGSGVTSVTGSGATSVTGSGATSVTGIGATSGTGSGAASGTGIGATSGTGSGATSGTGSGATSETGSGATSVTRSRATSGTGSEVTSGTGNGPTSVTGSGATSGTGNGAMQEKPSTSSAKPTALSLLKSKSTTAQVIASTSTTQSPIGKVPNILNRARTPIKIASGSDTQIASQPSRMASASRREECLRQGSTEKDDAIGMTSEEEELVMDIPDSTPGFEAIGTKSNDNVAQLGAKPGSSETVVTGLKRKLVEKSPLSAIKKAKSDSSPRDEATRSSPAVSGANVTQSGLKQASIDITTKSSATAPEIKDDVSIPSVVRAKSSVPAKKFSDRPSNILIIATGGEAANLTQSGRKQVSDGKTKNSSVTASEILDEVSIPSVVRMKSPAAAKEISDWPSNVTIIATGDEAANVTQSGPKQVSDGKTKKSSVTASGIKDEVSIPTVVRGKSPVIAKEISDRPSNVPIIAIGDEAGNDTHSGRKQVSDGKTKKSSATALKVEDEVSIPSDLRAKSHVTADEISDRPSNVLIIATGGEAANVTQSGPKQVSDGKTKRTSMTASGIKDEVSIPTVVRAKSPVTAKKISDRPSNVAVIATGGVCTNVTQSSLKQVSDAKTNKSSATASGIKDEVSIPSVVRSKSPVIAKEISDLLSNVPIIATESKVLDPAVQTADRGVKVMNTTLVYVPEKRMFKIVDNPQSIVKSIEPSVPVALSTSKSFKPIMPRLSTVVSSGVCVTGPVMTTTPMIYATVPVSVSTPSAVHSTKPIMKATSSAVPCSVGATLVPPVRTIRQMIQARPPVQNALSGAVSTTVSGTALGTATAIRMPSYPPQVYAPAALPLITSYQPVRREIQPLPNAKPKPKMTTASTQTDEVIILDPSPLKKVVPKTRKQKLVQRCSDTWKHVGNTIQLVKDEQYLTQLNEQLVNFLAELRQVVSVGRVKNLKHHIKEEPVFESIPGFDAHGVIETSATPAKMRHIELPYIVEDVVIMPAEEANTYYELEYVTGDNMEATASIKLEEGIDHSGIQQIIDAFTVVRHEEVVQFQPP